MDNHGPENADHEIRTAYNCAVESALTYSGIGLRVSQIDPDEVQRYYLKAFEAHRKKHLALAERWARTAKHLARAYWHEAKIAWLEKYEDLLPYLEPATRDEYHVHEFSDTTEDLLNSLSEDSPSGGHSKKLPEDMQHYLGRGHKHLDALKTTNGKSHELLRAERIKAAHEYARVVECLGLVHEAELKVQKSA